MAISDEERKRKAREKRRRWVEANPEKAREARRRFNERNPGAQAEYQKKHNRTEEAKERRRQWIKNYRANNAEYRERQVVLERQRRKRVQRDAIEHYGGKCYCCGEEEPSFLALDHIEGGGTQHRKELGNLRLADWAKRNGYPPILRAACHNCNVGAHINGGVCPHQDVSVGG